MNGKVSPKINNKVKGVGQECPTHMGNTNIKSNGNTKVRASDRSVRPTRVVYFPAVCSIQSHL